MQSFTCVRCKYESKLNYGGLKNEVLALNSLHMQKDTFLWFVGLLKTEWNQTLLESLTEKRSVLVQAQWNL